MKNKPKPIRIDRDKLRAAIRKLGREYILYMLIDAIDMLPRSKLHMVANKYIDIERLHPDAGQTEKPCLLAAVKQFEKASRAGDYYESFFVDSRNYREQSTGTSAWIAEFCRLLSRCVTEAKKGQPTEVLRSMDILFGLLDQIDECRDDIIFFADEGGSWQVGADWDKVLPAWFKVLSTTVDGSEYAQRIVSMLSRHYRHGRDKMLAIAHRTGTPDQRKALAKATGALKR